MRPSRLHRSAHLSTFAHLGAVYLFHDLYGYLLEMSPDIVELIDAFEGGADTAAVLTRFAGTFGDADPGQFVDVLYQHACLVEPGDDERAALWPMVAVKGRWIVWRRVGDRVTLWTAWGERPVTRIDLDEVDTAIWDDIDGERRLAQLRERHQADRILALVERLAHSDVQAVKLAMLPMSTFAKRPGAAPRYLASTMPYPRWRRGEPVPPAASAEMTTEAYYQGDVVDADAQFDHQETTLSHLLRVPHPALGGRRYGEALVGALVSRGAIPEERVRVLEIGGGLGYVAAAVVAELQARGREVEYHILELSPALAKAQRERTKELPVTIAEGDALTAEPGDGRWDLVISNEMIGDLPARRVARAEVGLPPLGEAGDVDAAKLAALGVAGAQIAKAGISLHDAPDDFYVMTGAFSLVERIARWLAPGGTAVVTEFGDLAGWPRLSTHLDHPELSIHFGQLAQAARAEGLEADVVFVIDLLDVDRDQQGLATTRSHFRALRAMLADAGVTVEKVGYTPAVLAAALGDTIEQTEIGELRWDRIEDRLMGLVPHEFKALIARRPGTPGT
jgi:SAM-dependent methyltransferase